MSITVDPWVIAPRAQGRLPTDANLTWEALGNQGSAVMCCSR